MNELIFAIKDEKLVSIDDVEKGVQCGCICPCCGENLVAKKGNIKCHHFAHISGSNCDYGYETSLHRLAKEMMEELDYIVLPSVEIGKGKHNGEIIYKPFKAKIQKIELEKKFNNIRPDILITVNNKILAIEIYVNHKVDFDKIQKVKADNLAMIEINLRELNKDKEKNNPSKIKEILKEIFLSENDDRKYWVFNKKKNEYIKNNNLQKNVIYYFGKPFVDKCPKLNYFRNEKSNLWANVKNHCKECMYFLEYDKTTLSVLCSNKENFIGVKADKKKSIPINYFNNHIIVNCNAPIKPLNKYTLKREILIDECINCNCFISGDKNSINCLLRQ